MLLHILHNEERSKQSIELLTIDAILNEYARNHAEWMNKSNKLRHSNINELLSDGWTTAGENIAWGQKDEKEVIESWMNSHGHRANILNRRYNYVGYGRDGDYWCVVFCGK